MFPVRERPESRTTLPAGGAAAVGRSTPSLDATRPAATLATTISADAQSARSRRTFDWGVGGADSPAAGSASPTISNSMRTSPASRHRRFGSLCRHRASRARSRGGIDRGRAL